MDGSTELSIRAAFPLLNKELIKEIIDQATVQTIPANQLILKEGQYVKVIPLVLEGLIKVFSKYDDKDLLLYYIEPKESCVMSFSYCLKDEPSKVFAITEEETRAILLPVEKVVKWIKQYPDINTLFFMQYNSRYSELLDTINHILFDSLDKRIFTFLEERIRVTKQNPLKISHRQIASELGTAREVVSRILKRLETEGKIKQHTNSIEIL
jgi:CRP/FNR family transcriptional regulator